MSEDVKSVLEGLEPLPLPKEVESADDVSIVDIMADLARLTKNAGKASIRASSVAELTGERVDELKASFEALVQAKEDELIDVRSELVKSREQIRALALGICDVADVVAAASSAVEREGDDRAGELVGTLREQVSRILLRLDVIPTAESRGPFNPGLHECLDEVEHSEIASHHIVEVVRQGYRHAGEVLRIARVTVAR